MAALTIEQFEKNQTLLAGINFYPRPSVKFNSEAKSLKPINGDVVLKRNNARIRPQDLYTALLNLGTMVDGEKWALLPSREAIKINATHGTGSLDFWLGETKLSDYGTLVDDYDVAEVEEMHMQSASKYGW